jgi:hypothetical protein
MRVLLIDFDSAGNLALKKICAWERSQGNEVGFDIQDPNKVYVSVIFKENREQALGVKTFYPNAEFIIGGSGYSLDSKLPDEIELIKPDYDLYPDQEYSQGYTTRGCVRKCEFCVVPKKEGGIRIAQHPSVFHDTRFDTCMIMDNNLFGAPDKWQAEVFNWFYQNNIKMLSPQGWDIRLLNDIKCYDLKRIKHGAAIHFAWDNIKDEKFVLKGIKLLRDTGFDLKHKISFYVLCGFDFKNGIQIQIPLQDNDIYRCEKLKEMGVQAYVMPYHKNDKRINALARWTSRPWLYWTTDFKDYKKKGWKNNSPSVGRGSPSAIKPMRGVGSGNFREET